MSLARFADLVREWDLEQVNAAMSLTEINMMAVVESARPGFWDRLVILQSRRNQLLGVAQ